MASLNPFNRKKTLTIHGVLLSPNVRKVTAALHHKGIEFENEPVRPGTRTPEFLKISPLGYIPALEHGKFTVSDSAAIIEYLEDIYPKVSLLPRDPKDRARARFLSDFGGSKIFPQCADIMMNIAKPEFANRPYNKEEFEGALNVGLHDVLDILEGDTPSKGFYFDNKMTIADIAIVAPIVSAYYGGYKVDPTRAPKMAAYVDRVMSHETFVKTLEPEKPLRELAFRPEFLE